MDVGARKLSGLRSYTASGGTGAVNPTQLSFPPITLNLDHLVSYYRLLYVKEHRLKLFNAN